MTAWSASPPRKAALAGFVISALVAMSFLGGASTSVADTRGFNDPDDTEGVLDFAKIRQYHTVHGLLAHDITTHDTSTNDLWSAGDIDLWIHTNGDSTRDRTVTVRVDSRDMSLYGEMSNANGKLLGFVHVVRTDDRTITVEFPKRMLGRNITRYRWVAVSMYIRPGPGACSADGPVITWCLDGFPNSGGPKVHRLE